MNFHVQTPDGTSYPLEFPTDLALGIMLRELVTNESLKLRPPKPEAWHLLHENSDQKLDISKNLEQNGVVKGEHLRLKEAKEETPKEPEPVGSGGMKRCDNGHYYDPKKHAAGCPYCGAAFNLDAPRSLKIGPPADADQRTRVQGFRSGSTSPGASADVITEIRRPVGDAVVDPVVGWFVSVHGLEKGKDYRIRSENNTIGRSKEMYICISGDESISRERHAVVTFDPQRNAFHLSPGDGRGLVYVNGDVLLAPRKLEAYDQIQLGKTRLVFVPFCGEKFTWGKDDD